jgi:hypothetical protein
MGRARGGSRTRARAAAPLAGHGGSLGGGEASVPIDGRTSVLIDALAQPE